MEYLAKLMPLIGSMTYKELGDLGFPLFEKVIDVQVMDGKMYSTEMPQMVKKGVPFLLNGEIKTMYDEKGYPKGHYVSERDYCGKNLVVVKTEGILKYKCHAYHCHRFPGVDGGHYHTIKVGEKFMDFRGSVMHIKHTLLGRLPRVVSRARMIEEYKYSVSEADLNEYMNLMEFHPKVKKYGNWFLIEGSSIDIDPCDMELLAREASNEGLNAGDYVGLMFNVELFWDPDSINKIFEKSYVYKMDNEGDERYFVDVKKYAETVGDRNFLKLTGLTPGNGGLNEKDICIWKDECNYWPVYYYGK